jgi:hypothetical protein
MELNWFEGGAAIADRDGVYVMVGPIWDCAFEIAADTFGRVYA